jgi:hypothetical protein
MIRGSGIFVLRINKLNDLVIIFYESWRKVSNHCVECIVEHCVLTFFRYPILSTTLFL